MEMNLVCHNVRIIISASDRQTTQKFDCLVSLRKYTCRVWECHVTRESRDIMKELVSTAVKLVKQCSVNICPFSLIQDFLTTAQKCSETKHQLVFMNLTVTKDFGKHPSKPMHLSWVTIILYYLIRITSCKHAVFRNNRFSIFISIQWSLRIMTFWREKQVKTIIIFSYFYILFMTFHMHIFPGRYSTLPQIFRQHTHLTQTGPQCSQWGTGISTPPEEEEFFIITISLQCHSTSVYNIHLHSSVHSHGPKI